MGVVPGFLIFILCAFVFLIGYSLSSSDYGEIFYQEDVDFINSKYDAVYSLKKWQENGGKLNFFEKIRLKSYQKCIFIMLKKGSMITRSQANFAYICGYGDMFSSEKIIESSMKLVQQDWILMYVHKPSCDFYN